MSIEKRVVDHIYTLGIASKLSGVPSHSIRQYIDKGLILPFRTDTNRHLFSEIDIQRLINIKKYIDKGLNIAGLKTLYAQVHGTIKTSCSEETCPSCVANLSSGLPCWVAKKNEVNCKDKECHECEVYMMADPVEDLRNYFLKLKKN